MANGKPNGSTSLNDNVFSIAESHEDRLQVVEENLREVTVSIAKLQTHQEYMSTHLDANGATILSKLDAISAGLASFESRLEPVESHIKASKARTRSIKAVFKKAGLALVAAIATGVGSWVWANILQK